MVKEGERRNLFLKLTLWKIYKQNKIKKLDIKYQKTAKQYGFARLCLQRW